MAGSYKIPDSVTSIGIEAFIGCSLTNVTVGTNVTSIGDYAFVGCTSLAAITVDANNPAYSSVAGVLFDKSQMSLIQYSGGMAGSYTIPNSVTSIGDKAFYNCTSLTNLTIGNSVTNIGSWTFDFCSKLASVTIPNSVTSIGYDVFADCTSLTSVTIPNSVISIGDYAFDGCTSLTGVTIPNSVTNIGAYAFYNCTHLTNLTIGNSVNSIGDNAFNNCTSLTSVTIGNSVTSIGENAFYSSGLTSITIPNSVTNIGDYAFYYCQKLTSVYFKGNAPGLDNSLNLFVFNGNNNATVYYLTGTTGWSKTFGGLPTKLWNPQAQTSGTSFGVRTNRFGFTITGSSYLVIVVESSTNLATSIWTPVGTNTLTNGSSYFSDPQWTNYPGRFYRLRSP